MAEINNTDKTEKAVTATGAGIASGELSVKKLTFRERNRLSDGYLARKMFKKNVFRIFRAVILFGLCMVIITPLLIKISVSFMSEYDLYNPAIVLIPEHFSILNYELTAEILDYGRNFWFTLLISFTSAILQTFVCTFVGYGFARFKFPLKRFWLACVVVMYIVIPFNFVKYAINFNMRNFDIFGIIKLITGDTINLSGAIPYYTKMACCMGLKNGLFILLIKSCFSTVPQSFEEAAALDGCGTWKTFIKIMLPQAKSVISSCFLLAFSWQWVGENPFLLRSMDMLGDKANRLTDVLGFYITRYAGIMKNTALIDPDNYTSLTYADCIRATEILMIIMPIVILYAFTQKKYIDGIVTTKIKL